MAKAKFLLPSVFRLIGIFMALAGSLLGYFTLYKDFRLPALEFGTQRSGLESFFYPPMNLTDELAVTLIITGLIFTAFSRLKTEDELTARLRMDALHWAVFIHLLLIPITYILNNLIIQAGKTEKLFGPWTILSDADWIIYTLFTPLLIYIIRFQYLIWRLNKGNLSPQQKTGLPPVFKWLGISGSIVCILIFCITIMESRFPLLGHLINEQIVALAWYTFPLFALCWLFAKRHEDEYHWLYRLDCWQLALYSHYFLILLLTYTVYGVDYLAILFIFSPFLLPVLFILFFYTGKIRLR